MALILVTGASAGLGLETATSLAEAGHDVVLHARRADRIADPGLHGRMRATLYADLSDLDATMRLAREANELGVFDAVIHNAGVLSGADVMAVNLVAPYVLTALMNPPRRAIFLSSSMHRGGSTDLGGDLSRRGYSDSKLYVTALAMAYAKQRPDALVHAVDPGWVPTRMGGRGAPDSLEEGHRTQEWLATAAEGEIVPRTGAYWYHRSPQRPHPATRDPRFQRELVAGLAQYTGIGSWTE